MTASTATTSLPAGPTSACPAPRPGALRGPAGHHLLDAAPTQFAGGFFGDYTGLAADRLAYPAWSDTRNPAPLLGPGTATPGTPPRLCVTPAPNAPYRNDQEIYTAAVRVPSG